MIRARQYPTKQPKSVIITGSEQFNKNGGVPNTRRVGDIKELRDKYGYNLPPLTKTGSRLRPEGYQTNYWYNHGSSPPVVRLLFTGRLPLTFFSEICYGKKVVKSHMIHLQPPVHREKELWEPKGDVNEHCKNFLLAIHDARERHRKILEQVKTRAKQHNKQVNDVMLRQREIEHRAIACYLNKSQRMAERVLEKWKLFYQNEKEKKVEKQMENEESDRTESDGMLSKS